MERQAKGSLRADLALALNGERVVLKDVGGSFHIAGNERVMDSHTVDLEGTARLLNHPERQAAAMVAEGFHVDPGQVVLTQIEGYAADTPVHIIPLFEAAEKTDDEC